MCHFVALADCIRSGYVGGQFVITRNILSFTFLYPCLMCELFRSRSTLARQVRKESRQGVVKYQYFSTPCDEK